MSGYKYNFVNKVPDRLLCQICQRPCREPHRSVCCGHVFCKSELNTGSEQLGKESLERCPQCLEKGFIKFVDKLLRREINELSIYCPNNEDGCGWIGEIARVDDHLKECEISCSKCKQIVSFSAMKSHLDTECPCYCPYCDITAEREVISSKHKEKCSKFPITCPNNCGLDDIPRDHMDDHKKVCPLEMIHCEYHQCGAVIARNEIMEHDRLNFLTHIHSFKNELDRSFQNTTGLVNRCIEAERKIATLLSSVTKELDRFDFTLNFDDLTKEVDDVDSLAPQYVKRHPDGIFTDVRIIKHFFLRFLHNLIFLIFLLYIQRYYWKYNKSGFVYPQLALTEMDERLSITLSGLIFGCGFKKHPPSDNDLEYKLEYWRRSLDVQIITPVILEMPDFDKYTATNTYWYSGPFFAFEGGYVMCLKVYPAGTDDGEGTHVSVYLHLMKGPHDDKLKWPMRGQYAVELIDPTNLTCHPYYKNVFFDTRFADYNRITAGEMSNYGLGYSEYIGLHGTNTIAALSNLTVVNSFLTKYNSLFFMISYYTYNS